MRTIKVRLILGVLAVLAMPLAAVAAPGGHDGGGGSHQYTLEFIPTQNVPAGAEGTMTITPIPGGTVMSFRLRGAYPRTVYTIWTVFNVLDEVKWQQAINDKKFEVPSKAATSLAGFPKEGNGVTPTARLDSGFTNGMGEDPGASFVTNGNGDGHVEVRLDFDLINQAPVSNKDIIVQCAPNPPVVVNGACPAGSVLVKVTTTYLRKFIGQYPVADRAAACANYSAADDPDVAGYDIGVQNGADARLWQCVDPATADRVGNGLVRVPRFAFDHFRLANHPDALTHGFIGGNGTDHFIDMVGRRCDLNPRPAGTPACTNAPPTLP